MYQESGYIPGFRGVTPSFALKSAVESLKKFNLPIHAIGDGTATDINEWYEFINESYIHTLNSINTDTKIWADYSNNPIFNYNK